jgi:hypothetical protein
MSGTGYEEFVKAKDFLESKFAGHPDLKLVNRQLGELQPRSGWSLINELIQNAIDLYATEIKFTLNRNGDLQFQHNACLQEEPLDSRSIIGLCGVAESTKGLNTVGFMGIGFKFFTKFYSFVDVSDGDTHFRIKYPKQGDWKEKLHALHSPEWLQIHSKIESIYTTSFHFQDSYSEVSSKIADVFKELELEKFSLFVKKGLSKVIFQDETDEDNISTQEIIGQKRDDDDDVITISNNKETILTLAIEESTIASHEAKTFVVNNRSVDPELVADDELVRTVSLIIQLKEDESRLIPVPRNGELFCLVPLVETTFPFKIGLDADWFMDSERKNLKFDVDSAKWHGEMISPTLPRLIQRYLSSIDSDIDKEARRKGSDVFPQFGKEIEDQFKFLDDKIFKSKLAEELSSTAFVLTTEGKIVCPKDVKIVDDLSGGDAIWNHIYGRNQHTEKMSAEKYHEFLKCFNVPIIDRSSIADNTVNYLSYELELFDYPDISDIDVAKVRKLWNPRQPSNYLHILDLLSSMWQPGTGTLEVVPLKNGEWAELYGENIVFEKLPSEVNEKFLYTHLTKVNSRFEALTEVHERLQDGIKLGSHNYGTSWGDASGNKWKNSPIEEGQSFFDCTYKVSQEISSIANQDEKLATAILHFALRSNNPTIVKYVVTEDGISESKNCLIPDPYANIHLHANNKKRILNNSTKKILENYSEEVDIRAFLDKANLINMVPIEKRTVSSKPKTISQRTGITVGSDGPHRSTYASGNSSKKGAWTIIDWIWPISLDEFTPESTSNYLCEPSIELKDVMKKKAKSTMRLLYFYIKDRYANGTKDTTWIKELKTREWVICSDGELRKLSAAPIEADDSTASFSAKLSEDVIDFYVSLGLQFESSLDELSEEECLVHWKTHTVSRPQLFLSKLKSYEASNEVKLTHVLQTRWYTNGDVFESTTLSNFISHPKTRLGGYIGDTGLLDAELLDYLEEIGHQFPDINIPFDSLSTCISELNKLYQKGRFPLIITALQSCWKLIISNGSTSADSLEVLNSQNEVVMLAEETYYLHPFPEDRRFDLDSNSLAYEQFPPRLDILRKLTNTFSNLEIIDDAFEGVPQEEYLQQTLALQMLVCSMSLKIDIYLVGKNHRWNFQEKDYPIGIVVKVDSKGSRIYLNRDAKEDWVDDLLILLIEQNPERFGKSTKSIRELIVNFNTTMSFFEPLYHNFCNNLKLEIFDKDTIELELNELELGKTPDKLKESQPAKIRIATKKAEKQTKSVPQEPANTKEKPKKKPESNKSVSTVEFDHVLENEPPKTKVFTDKEIGDRAEEIVVNYLREKGWHVIESNEESQNNEGFDVEAQKDGIERLIEVKGVRREWKSVSMSHQQGLHFFRTVEKDDGGGKYEYWLCIVEKILNEDQTEVSKESPPIHPINLSREKPKHIFNFGQWSARNRPDTDF